MNTIGFNRAVVVLCFIVTMAAQPSWGMLWLWLLWFFHVLVEREDAQKKKD